jgi:hypothetical protein
LPRISTKSKSLGNYLFPQPVHQPDSHYKKLSLRNIFIPLVPGGKLVIGSPMHSFWLGRQLIIHRDPTLCAQLVVNMPRGK